MIPSDKKIERMIHAARLYYEKDMTQSQIAKEMGISRPLVSNLLTEAKTCGIVTITINAVESREDLLVKRLTEKFGIQHVVVIPDKNSADATDKAVAMRAFQSCFEGAFPYQNVGIGWGSMMGRMADYAESIEVCKDYTGSVFPLIGGIRASYRGYHTNEIIRIMSVKTGLEAEYLYSPAIFDSEAELEFFRGMANSHAMNDHWNNMDIALVGISNYPSYPDLGVKYRFGSELTQQKAVGRILAHYYNEEGNVISPVVDNVFQVSVEQLKKVPEVVAVCSALLSPQSVVGALNLGVITSLILPISLAERILE